MWPMSKGDAAENQLARTFFQRAVDRDPTYAPGLRRSGMVPHDVRVHLQRDDGRRGLISGRAACVPGPCARRERH